MMRWEMTMQTCRSDLRGGFKGTDDREYEKETAMADHIVVPWDGSVLCCRNI